MPVLLSGLRGKYTDGHCSSPEEEGQNGEYKRKRPTPLDAFVCGHVPTRKRFFCFAQGNREGQLVTPPPETATPFPCDSLDPKVGFDIYRQRMERRPILCDDHGSNDERCLMFTAPNPFGYLKHHVCSSRLIRIR